MSKTYYWKILFCHSYHGLFFYVSAMSTGTLLQDFSRFFGKPQKNKVLFLLARPLRPYPHPLSLVATFFRGIFLELQKSDFFLDAPPSQWPVFLAASLSHFDFQFVGFSGFLLFGIYFWHIKTLISCLNCLYRNNPNYFLIL